jgi:curli biogenesis system outer membrane secretion channel CsgG
MRNYILPGLAFALLSILILPGCKTTVGKPFEPESLDPYDFNQKFLVSVVPFGNPSGDPDADRFTDSLVGPMISELDENGRFRVIERERLDSLLVESEFSLSDLADSSNTAEIGRLLGVDALCFTNIAEVTENTKRSTMLIAYVDTQTVEVVLDSRVVYVETGEILATATSTQTKGRKHWVAFGFMKAGGLEEKANVLSEALQDGTRELANQLSGKAPRK